MTTLQTIFPDDVASLPRARAPQSFDLGDGDRFTPKSSEPEYWPQVSGELT